MFISVEFGFFLAYCFYRGNHIERDKIRVLQVYPTHPCPFSLSQALKEVVEKAQQLDVVKVHLKREAMKVKSHEVSEAFR